MESADEVEEMVQGAHRKRLGYATLKCEVEQYHEIYDQNG